MPSPPRPETGDGDIIILNDVHGQLSSRNEPSDLRQYFQGGFPSDTPESLEAEFRLRTAAMGKLLRENGADAEAAGFDMDASSLLGGDVNKSAAVKNTNAAAERVAAKKKRMAQTLAAPKGTMGLLNLETLKTLFSASVDASAAKKLNEESIIDKKAKKAMAARQKRALNEVLEGDTDLIRIVKEAEHIRELQAKEDGEEPRPSSEPGRKKKKLNNEFSSGKPPAARKKAKRKKKAKQDFSRFHRDLKIVQPNSETDAIAAARKKNAAPKINIANVVKKAKMTLREFQLIEMRYTDVEKFSVDMPKILLETLEQYSDPSDEITASVISRDEAKAALEECEMSFDRDDLEKMLDAASENVLDSNSVNFKTFCAKAMKRYRKDTVCVQLGSAKARKATAAQTNPLSMFSIVEDDASMDDDGSSLPPHAAFLLNNSSDSQTVSSNPNLPPLKIQQALAVRHLKRDGNFDENYGRETPHLLQSNSQASIQDLRRELAVAEAGLQQLNSEVKKGVQWVQLNCPTVVKNNRAKKYCKQWGVEKLRRFLMGQDASNLVKGFEKWKDFIQYGKNIQSVDKYIRVKTCYKIFTLLSTFCLRQQGSAFMHWNNVMIMQRNKEYNTCSIEIQRLIRGFLGRAFAHEVLRDGSACKIQNRWKCKKAKAITDGLRIQKERNDAAILLQRRYRGYKDMESAKFFVQGKREQKGALAIQTRWRGRGDRERVAKLKEEKEMNDSASLLQNRFRGFEARKEVAKRKRAKEMHEAACVIQRRYRGVQGQLIYAHKKLERDSANMISGAWRVYKAKETTAGKMQAFLKKKQMEEEDKAARVLQGRVRQFSARKRVGTMRKAKQDQEEDQAARILQNRARGFGARKKVNRMKQRKVEKEEQDLAATKLQGRFRIREAKKTSNNKRENNVRLEEEKKRRWQAQHNEELRKEMEEQDKAARIMQGKARQFGAKKQVGRKRRERDRQNASKIIRKNYRTHRFLMKFNKKAHDRKLKWMKEAEEKAKVEAEKERRRKEMELKEMNAAATKIQNVFRGRRARRKVEKRRNELAVLEAEAEKKRILAEQNAAAQRLCNFFRIITAKIKVRRKKEEHKKRIAELEAAGDIGAAEIEEMKRKMQAEIQAMELSASMQAEQDKKDLLGADAAAAKALEEEKKLEDEQEEVERERAALKIQGVYKKRKARIEARKVRKEKIALREQMKKEEEERKKREEIERKLRENAEEEERKKAAALLIEENKSAVMIQGCYRSRMARRKVQAKKKAMMKEAEMIKKKAETMRLRMARETKALKRLPNPSEARDKKLKEIDDLGKKCEELEEQAKVTRQDAIKHGIGGNMAASAERKKFEEEQARRIALMEEENKMHEAALKIQGCFRRRKARRVLEQRKKIALLRAQGDEMRYEAPGIGPPLGTFIRPGSVRMLARDADMKYLGDDMEQLMQQQMGKFLETQQAKAAKEYAERRTIEKEKAKNDLAIAQKEFNLVMGEEGLSVADTRMVELEVEKAREEGKRMAEEAAKKVEEEASQKIRELEARFESRMKLLEKRESRLMQMEMESESSKLMALHAQGSAENAKRELEVRSQMEEVSRKRRELEEREAGGAAGAIVSSNPEEVRKINEGRAITPSSKVVWKKIWDNEANSYYYLNQETNQAQWERPEGRGVSIAEGGSGGGGGGNQSGGEVTDYDTDNAETAGYAGGGKGGPRWEEFQDDSGKSYWYNAETQESVWEDPNKDPAKEEAKKWVSHIDPSTGVAYWFNKETGETKWDD